MSENEHQKPSGTWAQIISELISFIPKDLRELIGLMGGMYILISLPVLIIGGVMFVTNKFNKPELPTSECWKIQKIENRIFKLNACTGETVEIGVQKAETDPQKQIDISKRNR